MAKLSGNWIKRTRRLAIYLRDGFTCVYCGRDLHEALCPHDLTLDHLRPRSLGGGHDPRNLVTACRFCNSSRGNERWRRFASPESRAEVCRRRRRVLPLSLARALVEGEGEDAEVET